MAPKKPPKNVRQALLVAYIKQRDAKLQNAPIRVQQRLWDAFDKKLNAMFSKYRDYLGPYPLPVFFDALDRAAVVYRATRIMSGAGVDW